MKVPFRRNKKDDVPEEIQEYYQAERRERAGVAWLVALATLLITLAVVLGLFYGGRWVYRKIADGDRTPPTTQTETKEGEQAPQDQPDGSQEGGEQPATPPQPESPENQDGQDSEDDRLPGGDESEVGTQEGGQQTPAEGGSGAAALPDSGPGEVLGMFAIVSLAGALTHHLVLSRRFER